MARIITFFNHKGGVSKTTTTYNVGWSLTLKGRKVLLVDGDPQCNLTGLFMNEDFDSYYENDLTSQHNIKDGVSRAFDGKPLPIEAIDCYRHPNNENLWLLPGHMDLAEYEPPLNLAINSNNAISTLQNLPGSFFALIDLCSKKYNIDYVFIDMNPGLSSINQVLFSYCDIFIVPTNPDPFSLMALKTLYKILPRWKDWAVTTREIFKDASYPLPNSTMSFLGIIIQRFSLRNSLPARSYDERISLIQQYTKDVFIPEMMKHGMLYTSSNCPLIEDNARCLTEISEFGALLQRAVKHQVPLYALSDEQIGETGPIQEQLRATRNRFSKIFMELADKIIGYLECN